MILVKVETGEVVAPGSMVTTFRGEPCRFDAITRNPAPGKSGRVACTIDGGAREWFPNVIGCVIMPETELHNVRQAMRLAARHAGEPVADDSVAGYVGKHR